MTESTEHGAGDDDLREEARERMEQMPAETALGNRDPQGGGTGEPSDYEQGQEG
jgi:hypothetical protein